jgi:hypothetical protein
MLSKFGLSGAEYLWFFLPGSFLEKGEFIGELRPFIVGAYRLAET